MSLNITVRTIEEIVVVDCNGRIVFGDEANDLRDAVKELRTKEFLFT